MDDKDVFRRLLDGGALDEAMIDNLRRADPQAMRRLLSTYLPDGEVEAILARIAALIAS